MHVNTRNVVHKIDDLQLLKQVPVQVLALTETWLVDDDVGALSIPGYKAVIKSRKGQIGGGVAL